MINSNKKTVNNGVWVFLKSIEVNSKTASREKNWNWLNCVEQNGVLALGTSRQNYDVNLRSTSGVCYVTSDPIGLAGGLNTYGYVGGNPVKYVDPLGLDTFGVYGSASAGAGVGGTISFGFGLDDQGNIGLQVTVGAGGATPGASLTGGFEGSNAASLNQLEGTGSQVGIQGGGLVVAEGGAFFGEGYSGAFGGYGVGIGAPISASGFVTQTYNYSFNPSKLFNSLGQQIGSTVYDALNCP